MDDRALLRVLKALAHPIRFRMVQEIAAAGELSCGQVGDRFRLAQATISHHLKILNDAGVFVVRREGQHGFISVDRKLIDASLRSLPGRLASAARVRKPARKPASRPRVAHA
jgi:DNA-binding transcriptional ArsR family regulator